MNRLFIIASFAFCSSLLFSCQKVIKVDLNSTDPKVVVEAEFSDKPGPHYVKLTHTVNFDQPNVFPPVTGATVKLSDNAGNSEVLTEDSPGIYKTSSMTGVPGRKYTLDITANNKTYTAVSEMFQPVSLDSLTIQKGLFRDARNVHAHFTDPAGVKNWYRLVQIINDTATKDIYITEDILRDGQPIDELLFSNNNNDTLVTGDSIVVKLQSIDQGVYDYWRTFIQMGFAGPQAPTPANPKSNFSNGALGYFSAYAERSKAIRAK
jgi:hypothetical protein